MKSELAPVKTDAPSCFGVSYSAATKRCSQCPVRSSCLTQCQTWVERKSLSEAVRALEDEMRVNGDKLNLPNLYLRLYEQHYGTRETPDLVTSFRSFTTLGRVDRFCRENQISPALWITAQMHGMRMFIDHQRENDGPCPFFRINMLCGDKAIIRYNVYVRMAYKRYSRVDINVFDGRTDLVQICRELTEDEQRIGAYYCLNVVHGSPVSWADCIRDAEAGDLWRALHNVPGIHSTRRLAMLRSKYDAGMLTRLCKLATLRAAFSVASSYAYDLPDRIGFRNQFSWNDFALLLLRLYGPEKATGGVELKRVSGLEWRGF